MIDGSRVTGGGLTIAGGDGNDELKGGAGNDSITGGNGVDTIYAYGGDDVVHAEGDGLCDNILDGQTNSIGGGDTLYCDQLDYDGLIWDHFEAIYVS